MREPLSSLTRWVVAGVLAGITTSAIGHDGAHGFLNVNGIRGPRLRAAR